MAIVEEMHFPSSQEKTHTFRSFFRFSWVRECASLFLLAAVIISVYYPIILRRASVMTDTSRWPYGALFVGDPAAGGQITYYKELAVAQAWSHLHLPLWLPTEGYGITLAGNQAAPWFLPEIVMHLLFPGNFSLWNVSCVFLAAAGAYVLARHLGMGRLAAIASGLIYGLSGPMVANLNLDMINPIAVTPFAIVAALRLVESRSDRRYLVLWWALTALAVSQLFLSGFAEVLPLEMALIGLLVLVRTAYLARSRWEFIRLTARWVGAAILGLVGSLIASVSLILPLSMYKVFQPAGAELAAEPKYWWLTLIDPWAFGRSLAGGPFEASNTVWTPGNPLIYMFVAAAVLGLLRVPRGWSRAWRIAMIALVAFGLLGFANILGVLNVLRIPPLDLIYSPRFLPFLWWLPAALMTGAGLEAVARSGRRVAAGALAVTIVAAAILVSDVFVKGGAIFPAIDSKNLASTIRSNLPVGIVFVIGAVIVVTAPRRWRSIAGLLGVASLVLLLVPRNFFPVSQAPQQLGSVAKIIRNAGLGHGLSFSPGDYTVPSGLIGSAIPSIQAFDVFFPKGYSDTIAHYFGQGNPMSTTSPLYPAAPSMMNVPVNGSTVPLLRRVGVETVVVPFQLNAGNMTSVSVLREPPGLGINATKYQNAMQALVSVYLSRPDLMRALRLPVSQWGLVQWPMAGAKVHDNSALSLEQYFPVYQRVLAFGVGKPSVSVLREPSVSVLREPPGLGINATKYQNAMQALVSVYLSRPDLMRAFPLPVSQLGLVQWPMAGAKVHDPSALSLEQYFPVYQRVLAFGVGEPSVRLFSKASGSSLRSPMRLFSKASGSSLRSPDVRLFREVSGSSLRSLGVRLLGVGTYLGTKEYVYDIGGSANALPVVAASSVRPYPAGNRGAPIPLDGRVAYVPASVAGSVTAPNRLAVKVSGFTENASGMKFTIVANHRGLVFLRRQIAPGERITVNGRQVGVVPVDNFLTGVVVKTGKQQIVISYESPLLFLLFWSGLAVNALLVITICVSCVGIAKRRTP